MKEKQSAELNHFKSVLDTYGAARQRWPDNDLALMEKLLLTSDVARSLLRQEEKFDLTLHSSDPTLQAPSTLLTRVLIDAQNLNRGSIFQTLWPFGSIWQPASGLVMAAFVGVMLGVASPNLLNGYNNSPIDEPAFNDTLFDLEYENGNI
ncbi:MAG: hypothetical protein V7701_01770 [Sneathiella sp.]